MDNNLEKHIKDKNLNAQEAGIMRKVEFQEVHLNNGMEMMLSKNISEPLNYPEALEWCKEEGGRLPTVEELEALYVEDSDIRESFKEKTFWSSTEYYGDVWAYDFKEGKKVLRSKEEKLVSGNISNSANTRSIYIIK